LTTERDPGSGGDGAAGPSTGSLNSSTGLEPNIAALLCYLGAWVTGVIFLIIEKRDSFVRFHAVQSIAVFGALTVAWALLGRIPYAGDFLAAAIGIGGFILWVVLMVKAYQGELYRLPVAGDIAANIIPGAPTAAPPQEFEEPVAEGAVAAEPPSVGRDVARAGHRMDGYFTGIRATRVVSSVAIILWNVGLLVFFTFFRDYIAYYEGETVEGVTTWTRIPLTTSDYAAWLPVLLTTLVLSIAGHAMLIFYDRYWARQSVAIAVDVMTVVTVVALLIIFPFDFDAIPDGIIADVLPVLVRTVLIGVAAILGIATLVKSVRFLAKLVRELAA
jgi:uncharacterized membrane protein